MELNVPTPPSLPVAPAYLAEQVVDAVLCFVFGLVLLFQTLSEPFAPRPIVSVKKLYHRLGLVMVALQAARAVDPEGVHGILPEIAIGFISANVTLLVMACVAAALYYVASAIVGLTMDGKPLWLRRVLQVYLAICFVFINSCYIAMSVTTKEWPRGIAYMWWASSIALLVFAAVVAVGRLRAALKNLLASPLAGPKQEQHLQRSITKLLLLQIFGSVLAGLSCVTLVYLGIDKVGPDHRDDPMFTSDPDTYDALVHAHLWAQWGCLLLFVWWAWIPFYYCCLPKRLPDEPMPASGQTSVDYQKLAQARDPRREPLLPTYAQAQTRNAALNSAFMSSYSISNAVEDPSFGYVDTRSYGMSHDSEQDPRSQSYAYARPVSPRSQAASHDGDAQSATTRSKSHSGSEDDLSITSQPYLPPGVSINLGFPDRASAAAAILAQLSRGSAPSTSEPVAIPASALAISIPPKQPGPAGPGPLQHGNLSPLREVSEAHSYSTPNTLPHHSRDASGAPLGSHQSHHSGSFVAHALARSASSRPESMDPPQLNN